MPHRSLSLPHGSRALSLVSSMGVAYLGWLGLSPLANAQELIPTRRIGQESESILLIGSSADESSEEGMFLLSAEEPAKEIEFAEPLRETQPSEFELRLASLPKQWQLAAASQMPMSPLFLGRGVFEPKVFQTKVDERSTAAETPEPLPPSQLNTAPILTGNESSTGELIASGRKIRKVNIPMDDASSSLSFEPEPLSPDASRGPIAQHDPDDQKTQEAPVIDSRSQGRLSDEQGADALHASKPKTIAKRRITIDDPENQGKKVPSSSAPRLPALDPIEAKRLNRCLACLDHYSTHIESTSVRSPWAVMHAILPFGADYELQHGSQKVNAIGWMCHNGTCRTQRIFTPSKTGFIPNVGGGVQGHQGQFMAIMAQSGVPLDYPIQVGANKFRMEDLVRYEMATCKEKSELTFKLIGLSYYLDSKKQWRTSDGKVWSIPKLIDEELSQPIVGAACGGTHRLMGYTFAVKQRVAQGLPIDGQFARADKFVKDYVAYTWKLQNADGSFSTAWYERRADEPNDERKVQTTGHMLEWLMYTIPDRDINDPRVQRSIDFLLSRIYDNKDYKWPIGPRGHATRAIALYESRYQEIRETQPELLIPTTTSKIAAPKNPQPFSRK
jgi:hypothetical protein